MRLILLKELFNNKLLKFTFLIFIISTFLRIYSFKIFGSFSNDDIVYFKLAENLFSGNGYIYDMGDLAPHKEYLHTGNHIHFPPGYPFIVGIESIFSKSYKFIRAFEWIIISNINSFLILFISWTVSKDRKYIGVLLSFFSPVFIYGIGTINLGSEIWFLFFSLIGILISCIFSRNNKLIYLFISNIFFSISYLIRPEGILFFSSSILATFFYLRKIIHGNNKTSKEINFELILVSLCFLIPFVLFIFPYIFFIYKELGVISLTGKGLDWSIINSTKNSGIFTILINNFFKLIDVVFASPYFLGISFFFFSFLLLISFIFNKKEKRVVNFGRKINDLLILAAPLPFSTYAYLKNDAYARSIFCFLPSIIISILILSEIYNKFFEYEKFIILKNKKKLFISPLFCLLLSTSIFNLSLPIFSKNFLSDNPNIYYKALDRIALKNQNNKIEKINIWSRDLTGSIYDQKYDICNSLDEIEKIQNKEVSIAKTNKSCENEIDYFILSNLLHVSIPEFTSWESANLENKFFFNNGIKYTKFTQIINRNSNRKVSVYKKD